MKQWIPVCLCLLMALLCACGAGPAMESPSVPPASGEASSAPAAEQDYTYAHELAGQYDYYAYGRAPENGQLPLIMHVLEERGLKSDFTKDGNLLDLTQEDFKQMSRLFFAESVPPSDYDEESLYFWGFPADAVVLEPFEITEGDGGVTVLYGRFAMDESGNRHWLYPVRYSMECHTLAAEEIPAFMQGFKAPGDEVYRIRQVENIRDIAQAKEIYTKYGYGELLEARQYELKTPEDILAMAQRVNSGMYREITAAYALMNDIDMAGVDFSPIGTNQTPLYYDDERNPITSGFNGLFDGNGFSIKNLSFVGERKGSVSDANEFGFFSVLGSRSHVMDLRIENAQIGYRGQASAHVSAGILAASLKGGTIENTAVSGSVEGTVEVGGLCGCASGDFWSPGRDLNNPPMGFIYNCRADVDVKGNSVLGGLVGTSHRVSIEHCHAKGTVTTYSPTAEMSGSVGGFAGHNAWAEIYDSSAATQVFTLTPARCVGSFVGLNDGDIYNCFFLNTLSNWKPSGDSPRSELSNDVVGLDKEEFDMRMEQKPVG